MNMEEGECRLGHWGWSTIGEAKKGAGVVAGGNFVSRDAVKIIVDDIQLVAAWRLVALPDVPN